MNRTPEVVDLDLTDELEAIKEATASHGATIFDVRVYAHKIQFSVVHASPEKRHALEKEFETAVKPRCVVSNSKFPLPKYENAKSLSVGYTLSASPEYLKLSELGTRKIYPYAFSLLACLVAVGLVFVATEAILF